MAEDKKTTKTKKPAAKKPAVKKTAVKKTVVKKPDKYFEAVGRRKTSVARVRLFKKDNGGFLVNDKDMPVYFPTEALQATAKESLNKVEMGNAFFVSVHVNGGGINSQAEATRLGIARALIKVDPGLRDVLKRAGFLKRDPRMVERKKFGLKKARRAPQWSKR